MSKVLFIGDSITYGIVGGGGIPYKDAVKYFLFFQNCKVTVRAIYGSASVDWTPQSPFLPEGREPYASQTGPVLLYGEAGFDEVSKGTVHPWRDFIVPNLPVDVALPLIGGGDAIRGWPLGPGVPSTKDNYLEAMLNLTENLLENGAGKVVLSTPVPIEVPAWRARLELYKEAIQEILSMSIPNVVAGPDFLTELTTPGNIYFDSSDIIHPNAAGHVKIAELFDNLLITLI